ncbi:MAG: DUF4079 family protein [Nitrospirae bacterium]|nr:DUF4079 family protein [Nitrospirota bacterium]
MISRQILANLRLSHGFYNIVIASLFFYQGWLGLAIRRLRKTGEPPVVKIVKRHRKLGPVIAILSAMGLFSGITLALLDKGNILEYPVHFFVGCILVILILATYRISKKIKGRDSIYRNPHFIFGIIIVSLYLLQLFLGLGILL